MNKDLDRTDWHFGDLQSFGFIRFEYSIYSTAWGKIFSEFLGEKICDMFFEKTNMFSNSCMYNKEGYRVMVDDMGYVDVCYFDNDNNEIPYELLYTGRRGIKMSDIIYPIIEHKRQLKLESLLS